ncbi:hypothetical protein BDV19DRAFT_168798 [Aspergillus venezuelensis]
MADKRLWVDWPRFYRLILLHSRKRICRLTGISLMTVDHDYFHTRQAPWDQTKAIARSVNDRTAQIKGSRIKNGIATALPHEHRNLSLCRIRNRLTCIQVHARCWQLLCTH